MPQAKAPGAWGLATPLVPSMESSIISILLDVVDERRGLMVILIMTTDVG
jgi:hypothetical protein